MLYRIKCCLLVLLLGMKLQKASTSPFSRPEGGTLLPYKIMGTYHSPKDALLVHARIPPHVSTATWVFRQRDTFLPCQPRPFVAVFSHEKIPLDYLHHYIQRRNTTAHPSEADDNMDYDYHLYYSEEDTTYPSQEEKHNGRGLQNVHVVEGTAGSGWGKAVSVELKNPTPGRWYAALALLEGQVLQSAKVQPKEFTSHQSSSHCIYPLRALLKWQIHPSNITSIDLSSPYKNHVTLTSDSPEVIYRIESKGFLLMLLKTQTTNCKRDQPEDMDSTIHDNLTNYGPCYYIVEWSDSPSFEDSNRTICYDTECITNYEAISEYELYLKLTAPRNTTLEFRIEVSNNDCPGLDCLQVQELYRRAQPDIGSQYIYHPKGYSYLFLLQKGGYHALDINFLSTQERLGVFRFQVDPIQDIGGALSISLRTNIEKERYPYEVTSVCLQQHISSKAEFSFNSGIGTELIQRSEDASSWNMSIPYPRAGVWYLILKRTCYDEQDNRYVDTLCKPGGLHIDLFVTECLNNCSMRGQCITLSSGGLNYGYCSCKIGYKGLDCSESESSLDLPMLPVVLLTGSNAAFLPAIIIALKRGMLTEAVIYTFTMIISAAYHFCDVLRPFHAIACILPFEVLGQTDFFASILSFGATLLSMSAVGDRWRPLCYVSYCLFLLIAVQVDRTAVWVFAAPVGAGMVLLMVSWILKSVKRKRCRPSKRRLLFLVPGLGFSITALLLFTFASTTTNYFYVHSLWHFLISTSIVFLLPFPNKKSKQSLTQSPKVDALLQVHFKDPSASEEHFIRKVVSDHTVKDASGWTCNPDCNCKMKSWPPCCYKGQKYRRWQDMENAMLPNVNRSTQNSIDL